MGLVGDIADAAGGALGSGGASAPAAVENKPMTFKPSEAIDSPEGNTPGATAPNSYQNVFDTRQPIQFIHFGRVHISVCDVFPHNSLADDKQDALQSAGPSVRALQFRAALERETLLLHGFIRAAQRTVEERKSSSSDVEAVANMASSLLGGGGSSGPQPQNLDPYLDGVTKPGGTINKADISYKEIHKAGKDLHQARTNFNGNMPKVLTDSMGSSGGNPLGNLASQVPIPPIPGVGDVLKVIMDILFKMFELHAATYAKLREKFEPALEDACHARTLAAIREPRAPVFDVWSRLPPPAETATAQDKALDVGKTGVDAVDGTVDKANQGAQDVKDTASKAQKAWQDFWNTTPDPGPGEEQLRAAFQSISKPGELVGDAFHSVMKIQIPGLVRWPLDKICVANAGMLEAVFLALQDPDLAAKLDADALMAAGRHYIEDVIRGILLDLLPVFSVGPANEKWAAGKTSGMMDEYLGGKIEPVLEAAMGGLLGEFQAVRDSLKDKQAHTLEAYLGGAPLMLAVLVRNTYFSLWQLVVDEVLTRVGAGAAAAASPVRSMMNSARGTVADARKKASDLNKDIKDKATGAANDVKSKEQGLQNDIKQATYGVGSVGTPVGAAADSAAGAAGGLADSLLGGGASPGGGGGGGGAKFPGAKRETKGQGKEIKEDEWKDVQKNQAVAVV